ncbi:unnamed protein product [Clavelina lepadiformis]|uniref:Pentraxin (PTX) domain-containing protein n=1 Tax=Clavelina lepadiformis TaxID=159417 RepID=A0ABP0FJL9_CLALP
MSLNKENSKVQKNHDYCEESWEEHEGKEVSGTQITSNEIKTDFSAKEFVTSSALPIKGFLQSLESFQENAEFMDSSVQLEDKVNGVSNSILEDTTDLIQQNLPQLRNPVDSNNDLSGFLQSLESFRENSGSLGCSVQEDQLNEMSNSILEDATDLIQQNLLKVENLLGSNNKLTSALAKGVTPIAEHINEDRPDKPAPDNMAHPIQALKMMNYNMSNSSNTQAADLIKKLVPLAESMEDNSANTAHQNMMSTVQGLANKLGVSIPDVSHNQQAGVLQSLQTLAANVVGSRENKTENSNGLLQNITNQLQNKLNSTGSNMPCGEEGEFSGLLKNFSSLAEDMESDSDKTRLQSVASTVQNMANKLGVNIPIASDNQQAGLLQYLQTSAVNVADNRDNMTENLNGLLQNVNNRFRKKFNSTGSVMTRAEKSLLKSFPLFAEDMEGGSANTEHQNMMSTAKGLADKLGINIPIASDNQTVSYVISALGAVLNKKNRKNEKLPSNRNQHQLLKRTQSDLSHVRPFPTNIYYFKESETKNSKRAIPGWSSNRSRGYDFGSNATENTKNVADNDMVEQEEEIVEIQENKKPEMTEKLTVGDAVDKVGENQTNEAIGNDKKQFGSASFDETYNDTLKFKGAQSFFARLGSKFSQITFWKLMAVVTLATCAATIATVVTQVEKPFALLQTETSYEEANDTTLTMFETTCPGVSLRFPRGYQTTDYARYRGTGFFTRLSEATFCLWIDTEYLTRGTILISYATRAHEHELTLRFGSRGNFRLDLAGVRLNFPVHENHTTGHEHICASFSTSLKEVVLYIQGEIVGHKRYRGLPIQGGGDLILGQEQDSFDAHDLNPAQAFRGTIIDFLLWPRILSTDEIKAIYYRCHCPLDYRVNLSMDNVELFGAAEHFVNGTCPTFV